MSEDRVTKEDFEAILGEIREGYKRPETIRLYLAQQIDAAELRGIREGWNAALEHVVYGTANECRTLGEYITQRKKC